MEFMGQHLLQVLQSVHKNDIIVGDQTQRISLLEKVHHFPEPLSRNTLFYKGNSPPGSLYLDSSVLIPTK